VRDPLGIERVPVVFCLSQCWVRGVVELRGATRLSDLLNQVATTALTVLDGEVLPTGGRQWPDERHRLVVNKAEILFAHPVHDHPRAAAGLRLHKYDAEVGIYLGEYHVRGTIHLPDRLVWEQYLSSLRDRFLALTDATIVRAGDDAIVATTEYLAVSRERLCVLYEPSA
jgi:hypothetical protein